MIRSAVLSLVLFAFAACMLPTAVHAQKQTPMQKFKEYSYNGWVQAYYGHLYCSQSHNLALKAGFRDKDNQYALYYANNYSYYSFYYGYNGWNYGYADWIAEAARLADLAYQYELGAYDYINRDLYPKYPKQMAPIVQSTYYGYAHMFYARAYFRYAGQVLPQTTK